MNPDQTAKGIRLPKGSDCQREQSDLGLYCLQYRLPKSGLPRALEITENLENQEKKFHAWKIMEFEKA